MTFEDIAALLALTSLEIILGFDNIVILTVLVGKLPHEQRDRARKIGIFLAMVARIGLLLSINAIMLLTKPLFTLMETEISGRSLVLILGGLFLMGKATSEIHENTEGDHHDEEGLPKRSKSFPVVVAQIVMIDIVFSLDSVITAVGMAQHLPIMITAIVVSVVIMFFFAKKIGGFIEEHPTFKILALSFLVLVGVLLVAEGLGKHIEKGYIYFAMTFSLAVEFFNLRMNTKEKRSARRQAKRLARQQKHAKHAASN